MIWLPGVWVLRWQTEDGINMQAPFASKTEARSFRMTLGFRSRRSAKLQEAR